MIVYRGAVEDVIVSSRSGIVGYFVSVDGAGGRGGHGRDVAAVARSAGLQPGWNYEAVADYLIFGHPLGPATLHPGVARVPGGVVVRIAERGGRQERCVPLRAGHAAASVGSAVDALVDAVEQEVPADCALSMSGGLDSRLLLAACLALGRRPRLVISGVPGSFDREVATSLAERLGLPFTVTTVTADDIAAPLPAVAASTSGMIPADNWAGLAHLRSAPPGLPVLLGFNGEIARLYYAPPTGLGLLRSARSVPRGDRAVLLGTRFASPFSREEHGWLAPELRAALTPAAVSGRLLKAVGRAGAAETGSSATGALAMADRLFLEHYGRQKLGSDLMAIEAFTGWRTPLFAPPFVRGVRSLPWRWKAGDRFHRHAIARLCRPLLDAPEEGYGPRTSARVPARYWLRGPRPSAWPRFLDRAVFSGPRLLDLLARHADGLAGLVDPALTGRLAAEQAADPHRPHVTFRLLSLALWRAAGDGSIPVG